MTERQFATKVAKWVKDNADMLGSCGIEYKVVPLNRTTFSVKKWKSGRQQHQAGYLLMAVNDIVYHKISDQSSGVKPFDAFMIVRERGYLIIYYARYGKFICEPIEKIIKKDYWRLSDSELQYAIK